MAGAADGRRARGGGGGGGGGGAGGGVDVGGGARRRSSRLGALPDAEVDAYLYELVRRVEAGAAADGDAELPQTLSWATLSCCGCCRKGGYGKVFQVRSAQINDEGGHVTPDPPRASHDGCAATSTRRSTR